MTGEGLAPAADAATMRIGKYEVIRLLGRGGMGAVYQAFDPVLEREVALKVMLPETAGDPEQKQRFEREARAVARLSHPGVVTVFDLGYHTDGSPYIVMELLRGRDLLTRAREEPPLTLAQKVSIVAQVLDGLGHAHKAGIVHRDIKPANVFLNDDGAARIMDFGIAFWTASGGTSRTVLGTVAYMSPEQVRGERVDGRSDLFSVATLLHELLTGRRPFDAETPMTTFYRIARGEARLELPPGREHEGLLPVLQRALATAVEDRYPNAAEFAAALRSWLEASVAAAPAAGGPLRAQLEARPEPPPPDTPVQRPDPSGLLRLLREIYVGGKSGHLHITVANERKSLRVLRGQIVHGTSDKAGEHLGDVLVRYGLLSQVDLDRAIAIVLRERKRLGAVLGELGLLEKTRIAEAVGLHAREILFGAIGRAGVSCVFEEFAESLVETDLVCPVSTGQLILDATRRILDPELVRTVLGDPDRVLVLSPDPLLRAQKISLTPADGFVRSRVDGSLSAREVMALVPLAAEDAERSLFSLLCTGIVDYRPVVSKRAAIRASAHREPPRAVHTTPSRAVHAPPPLAVHVPPPLAVHVPPPLAVHVPPPVADEGERSRRPGSEELRGLILETHARLKRDHFEVLGIERTATQSDVCETYRRLARLLHPDAFQDPALADLREQREAVFIRISEAYAALREPDSRAAYEQAFEPSKLRHSRTQPAVEQPPAVSQPVSVSAAPAAPPPAQATADTPLPVDPRLMPRRILEVAMGLFDAGKYWEVIQQLEPMIPLANGPTQASARMLLALAYSKNPRWKKQSEGLLQSLIQDRPGDVPAHVALAELYRDAGLASRARTLYRRILEIEPGHAAAQRALAEMEPPPVEERAPSPRGGLFSRRR